MSNPDHEHEEFIIDDFVDHSVFPNSQSPQARELTFQHTARMWFHAQAVYRIEEPNPVILGDSREGLRRTLLNLQRVGHASPHPNQARHQLGLGGFQAQGGDHQHQRGSTRGPAESLRLYSG